MKFILQCLFLALLIFSCKNPNSVTEKPEQKIEKTKSIKIDSAQESSYPKKINKKRETDIDTLRPRTI